MAITKRVGNIQPKVELIGDWDKVQRALVNLPTAINVGSKLGKTAALKRLEADIKRNIKADGGSLGWKELSKRTLVNKKDSKHPNSILRMTGLYYRSIMIWEDNMLGTTYLGVKPRTYYPRKGASGPTVFEVASIMERGSDKIPARPLWRPTFKNFGGGTRIKGYIIWHVRQQILLQCGLRAKISF